MMKVPVDEGFDPVFLRKTLTKIDWRLVPFLAALYSISLIDRTNISLARAAGMGTALELQISPRYSIAVLMFFIPYILLEIPSQIGLRKFGAAIWLSTAVTLWGCMMLAMGFVKTWQQLTALRALVGIFEAALFPGAAYLISCWYIRRQVQIRLSFFYVMSVFVTGLSSILAYGLARIATVSDALDGWQWIFVVEGLRECGHKRWKRARAWYLLLANDTIVLLQSLSFLVSSATLSSSTSRTRLPSSNLTRSK